MFGADMYGNPYGYPPPVDAMGRPMAMGYPGTPGGQNGPQTASQRPPEDLIIRVTGMEGAKAYQLAANSRAALFDDTDDIVIIKSTDGAGFPSYRRARLDWIEEEPPQAAENFVTREELRAQFDELKGLIADVKQLIPAGAGKGSGAGRGESGGRA